ncbi:hypothetical protein EPIR_2902 [Erwinia piriflorinigrans CFBP 5888]|uniref:Uncharacterized protein n=1 Tax=Erwinia piriflorinigrans CFBP 5888 TaxID=1161919 RepID=V5ZAI3_9GAMM|nr:hypothetical protein EPIR_2902 [Erwinia piriflorinigrans CFBP 5888]
MGITYLFSELLSLALNAIFCTTPMPSHYFN